MNPNPIDEPAAPVTIHMRREALSLRDVADMLFRKKLWLASGILLIAGAAAAFLQYTPAHYKSEMLLLVKNDRPEPSVNGTAAAFPVSREVTESQIATEISLLTSDDILSAVVTRRGLVGNPSDPVALDRAVKAFQKRLRVTPGLKSNLISVSVTAKSPGTAAALLKTLADVYLDKHLQVHKVAGSLQFFADETARAEQDLNEAQDALAAFEQKNNTVSLEQQKSQLVKNLSDMDAARRDTTAALHDAEERTRVLRDQLAAAAPRITTQSRNLPNQYSTERLNTMLVELRNKRTDLLTKYQPTDRVVQEIDQQIAQTLAALDEAKRQVSKEEATDVNPIRQTLEGELLQAQNRLAGTTGRLQTMNIQSARLRKDLTRMSAITGTHDDLVRKVKNAENNYHVLAAQLEQTRIAEQLDRERISNVVVAEAPTRTGVPVPKVNANLISAVALGLIFVVGVACVNGLRRRKVYTPWELEGIVGAPVLGAVPRVRARVLKSIAAASGDSL